MNIFNGIKWRLNINIPGISVFTRSWSLLDLVPGSQQWGDEITIEKNFGVLKKHYIRISPEGIDWDGQTWPLASIVRINFYSLLTFEPDNTATGNQSALEKFPITTLNSPHCLVFGATDGKNGIVICGVGQFNELSVRLEQAVGLRLLAEYCQNLKAGKMYRFGGVYLTNSGMLLRQTNLLGGQRFVYSEWSDIHFIQSIDFLAVRSCSHKFTKTVIYFGNSDNAVLLARALELIKKHNAKKMSDLLELNSGQESKKPLHEIVAPFGLRQLLGELEETDHLFVSSAIEASCSGQYVKLRTYSIMHMFDLILKVIYAGLAILVLASFIAYFLGLDIFGFYIKILPFLEGN